MRDKEDEARYEQQVWLENPQTQKHLIQIEKLVRGAFDSFLNCCASTTDPQVAQAFAKWQTYHDTRERLRKDVNK